MPRRKVPVFLQQQRAECGLVSLAMIASFFDPEQTPDGFRALAGGLQQGADLHMLMRLADKADLIARPVRLTIAEMRRIQMPAILHWCMDHFVVLVRVKSGGVVINDPALGRRFVTLRELDECFTGVALEVVPGAQFGRQKHAKPIRLRDFFGSFLFPPVQETPGRGKHVMHRRCRFLDIFTETECLADRCSLQDCE